MDDFRISKPVPEYHLHIDGKVHNNEPFKELAREIGFEDATFERRGRGEPLYHMTKKYGLSQRVNASSDLEKLRSAATRFDYKGYVELEKVTKHWDYQREETVVVESVREAHLPFHMSQRYLRGEGKEVFKVADIHYSLSQDTDPALIKTLEDAGLLCVRPIRDPYYVFTCQFAAANGVSKMINRLEGILYNFTEEHAQHIPWAALMVETVREYMVSNIGPEHLPVVVDECKFE
ncbi:hypothetical protein HYV86_05450 [Candidatus Woesearchaeota archaeon]|nr:hypothetical protein [Candidatus Woesearchaeota archaeon]